MRLRFAEVDNLAFFEVGIDRVVIGKKAHKLKHAGRATAEAIPFDPETGTLANSILLGDDETTGPLPMGSKSRLQQVTRQSMSPQTASSA